MTGPLLRSVAAKPKEPVVFELSPIRYDGRAIHLRLSVCRADDGVWRGHMVFTDEAGGGPRQTAEIFRGGSEQELWESVTHLREHHLRDLYRSLE